MPRASAAGAPGPRRAFGRVTDPEGSIWIFGGYQPPEWARSRWERELRRTATSTKFGSTNFLLRLP
jgi:hypothetical protein